MRKTRRAAIAAALTLGATIGAAAPALASTTFQVVVNGNAEVTRQPLTAHQVVTCDGVAVTVQTVQGGYGTYEITTTPRLTATAVCTT